MLGIWLEVGVDSVGVGQGELAEGELPVRHDMAFDEATFGRCLVPRLPPRSLARSRARLSSMLQIANQSILIADSSLGKWPRFLVTFRS